MTLLKRNFPEDGVVHVGINKKFYNRKHEEARFNRDFEEAKFPLKLLGSQVKALRDKFDLYICFTPVKDGKRIKPNAQDSYIIAQDIDGAPIPKDLPPSYYWETSPGKFQGVWILDNPVTPQEQEIINRKLVAKYGFDPCGNDIVHYFRIPGTRNHKYASTFNVSGMQGEGTVYRKRDIIKHLKDVDIRTITEIENEPIEDKYYDLEDLIQEYSIGPEFRQILGTDRSEWAWNVERKMIIEGASKEEVKFVLLNAPRSMAKFNESNVDKEVHRVFAKMEAQEKEEEKILDEKPILTSKVQHGSTELTKLKDKGKKKVKRTVSIKKVDEIEPFDPTDFWLVEDFWENSSVGVIGAPSKSFKSTFTLNLACAVATGRPFDGREVKQGAVLILQGENNLSMEQHKIYSITGETDLPIYFVDDNITMDQIYKLKDDIKALGIKLLIIDPMYLLFGSGDINRHQDIVQRLEMLTDLRNDTGCSVMIVHHSRKLERGAKIQTSDMYGSAFIEGWYESMILLQRTSNNSSRMTTFFRNHKSGDVYDLVVDDNMGCKAYKRMDETAYAEEPKKMIKLKKRNNDDEK